MCAVTSGHPFALLWACIRFESSTTLGGAAAASSEKHSLQFARITNTRHLVPVYFFYGRVRKESGAFVVPLFLLVFFFCALCVQVRVVGFFLCLCGRLFVYLLGTSVYRDLSWSCHAILSLSLSFSSVNFLFVCSRASLACLVDPCTLQTIPMSDCLL